MAFPEILGYTDEQISDLSSNIFYEGGVRVIQCGEHKKSDSKPLKADQYYSHRKLGFQCGHSCIRDHDFRNFDYFDVDESLCSCNVRLPTNFKRNCRLALPYLDILRYCTEVDSYFRVRNENRTYLTEGPVGQRNYGQRMTLYSPHGESLNNYCDVFICFLCAVARQKIMKKQCDARNVPFAMNMLMYEQYVYFQRTRTRYSNDIDNIRRCYDCRSPCILGQFTDRISHLEFVASNRPEEYRQKLLKFLRFGRPINIVFFKDTIEILLAKSE